LTSAAYAADMPVKAPPLAPVPYVANWTGFFAGLQIGGASFEPSCRSDPLTVSHGLDVCATDFDGAQHTGSIGSASVIGGGKIGADYQWDRVGLGIVGEFDCLQNSFQTTATKFATFGLTEFFPGDTLTGSDHIDWLASARLRAGWAFDNVLLYATGGVAWTQIKANIGFVPARVIFSPLFRDRLHLTRLGQSRAAASSIG